MVSLFSLIQSEQAESSTYSVILINGFYFAMGKSYNFKLIKTIPDSHSPDYSLLNFDFFKNKIANRSLH